MATKEEALAQLKKESELTQAGKIKEAVVLSQAFTGKTETGITDASEIEAQEKQAAEDLATAETTALSEEAVSEQTSTAISEAEASAKAYEETVTARREQLATEKTDLEKAIAAAYSERRASQEEVNKELLGGTKAFLGRAGAFSSISGRGAIQKQVISNEEAINSLVAQEQSALLSARQAYNSADFDLLNKQLEAADSARQEINSLRQQQFSQLVSLQQLEMSASEAARTQASFVFDQISALSGDALTAFDTSGLAAIESSVGLPVGYYESLKESMLSVSEAAATKDQFETEKSLSELALQIPQGMSLSVGDYTVEGLKSVTPNRQYWTVDDGKGNYTVVTLDEDTGEIKTTTLEGIAKIAKASESQASENDFLNVAAAYTDRYFEAVNAGEDPLAAMTGIFSEISSIYPNNVEAHNALLGTINGLIQEQQAIDLQMANTDMESLYGTSEIDLLPDIFDWSQQSQFLFSLPAQSETTRDPFTGELIEKESSGYVPSITLK